MPSVLRRRPRPQPGQSPAADALQFLRAFGRGVSPTHGRHSWPDAPSLAASSTRAPQAGSGRQSAASAVRGDTVSAMIANAPAMIECHYGRRCARRCSTRSTRGLDAAIIAFTLDHAETKVLIVDREFPPKVIGEALEVSARRSRSSSTMTIRNIQAPASGWARSNTRFHRFGRSGLRLAHAGRRMGRHRAQLHTSGTTGDPKGVVYHHRGAHLLGVGNVFQRGSASIRFYLWTLPMFHCNGWVLPWTLSAVAGNACQRAARGCAPAMLRTDVAARRDALCGAPSSCRRCWRPSARKRSRCRDR